MRRVVVSTFVSLDGVMQAPGGPEEDPSGGFTLGGWTFNSFDETVGEAMDEIFADPFDLLLGRKTYEIFAAHWPNAEGQPLSERFNAATKYVATSSDEPLEWEKSVALRGDVPAEIARLKSGDGPDLLVQGSSVLLRSLFAQRLVDQFTMLIFPVLLGHGKRMFNESTVPGALQLERMTTSPSGVIIARYRPSGPVEPGSFALEQPPEAETERRRRLKQED